MQRERDTPTRQRPADDEFKDVGSSARQRDEAEQMLIAGDAIFDAISHQHAQQYLSQNQQTGGQ